MGFDSNQQKDLGQNLDNQSVQKDKNIVTPGQQNGNQQTSGKVPQQDQDFNKKQDRSTHI